jgi:hypothetical protein
VTSPTTPSITAFNAIHQKRVGAQHAAPQLARTSTTSLSGISTSKQVNTVRDPWKMAIQIDEVTYELIHELTRINVNPS